MKIFINDFTHPVKAEVLPSYTPTLDETLETFSFALISNDQPLPYAPMQKVKVFWPGVELESNASYFYIVSDSVETYSLNPLRYKHTISCIQNTRELSKHLVRNSVFSQPAMPIKQSFNSIGVGYVFGDTSHRYFAHISDSAIPYNTYSLPLILNSREKIKTFKVRLELKAAFYTSDGTSGAGTGISNGTVTWNENIVNFDELVFPEGLTPSFFTTLTLRYKPSGSSTPTTISLNFSDFTLEGQSLTEFVFNSDLESPTIKTILDSGATDLELLFDSGAPIQCNGYMPSSDRTNLNDCLITYYLTAKIIAETYYYSAYDILNLLIQRQKKETELNSFAPLFSLPQWSDSGEKKKLYDLLDSTVAPNFTFTELTMYECVAEVFRLFDAIFTMDKDGVLGIEYFNDLSKESITPKLTGKNLAHGEDKYTNGLISYYQDGRIEEAFPAESDFAHLRVDHVGIPLNESEHYFIVAHPIQSVSKFETSYQLGGSYTTNTSWSSITATNSIVLDLSHYIVDYELWNILNTGFPSIQDYNKQYQINTAYFIRGDNKIQIAYSEKTALGMTAHSWTYIKSCAISLLRGAASFISETIDWSSIVLRATYVVSVDGATKIHSLTNKYEGETLVDQANGAVDLNKLGLNMLGLSLKLGEPTLNATHKIAKWQDRIQIGQILNYEGSLWVANVVNYTFFKNHIQGKVSFVKNFNALALRTRLLREKRMSNISKELVQKSEEFITDFVYYSTGIMYWEKEDIHFNSYCFENLIYGSFDASRTIYKMEYAVIYDNDAASHSYAPIPGIYYKDAIYIPLVRYGAGNTINFEMSFESPMSAGLQTKAGTGYFGTNDYATFSVNYTDDEGFLDKISIKAPATTFYTGFDREFPQMKIFSPINTSYAVGFFDIKDFKVYKQPNEIFALNYQLAFLPYEKDVDFLGSQFINENAFIKHPSSEKKIFICFKEEKSSVLDVKAAPYFLKKEITEFEFTTSSSGYRVLCGWTPDLTTEEAAKVVSWCLVDENENVLFASNRELATRNSIVIRFITRKNRLTL